MTMQLTDSTVTQNRAQLGAGITNLANLTVTGSTLMNNAGQNGAGIWNSAQVTVTNSTLTNNVGTGSGGGIYNKGKGTAMLYNLTLAKYRAQAGENVTN